MLRHYLILAVKVLLRRKVFTVISLFGIVATLVVFVVATAFFDHAFGPSAPEAHTRRTLAATRVVMFGDQFVMSSGGGYRLFNDYARDLPGAERLAIFSNRISVASILGGQKVSLTMKRTDHEFWNVFDFAFVEGRPYAARDVEDAAMVAVISREARERLLGGRDAVGQSISVDGQVFRVAGVVENVSEMRNLPYADIWVPLTTAKDGAYRSELMGGFQAVVLARSPEDFGAIQAEFASRVSRMERPKDVVGVIAPFETTFEGLARQLFNDRDPGSKAPLLIGVMTACGLLLALLPTVNLINLNLSRILERSSEIGVRKAFGASSRTLVLQFIVENVLLTLAGAVVAFGVAGLVLAAINRSGLIAHAHLGLNLRVFLVGVALAIVFGAFSGAYPAWRMSRVHPVNALKGQQR